VPQDLRGPRERAQALRETRRYPRSRSTTEAARRLAELGPNELRRDEGTSPWRILARQFSNPVSALGTAGASEATTQLAARGLRVLAVAVGTGPGEADLTLLGLIGIADPPRTEAIEAIAAARVAGIRTIMITGDHPITAHVIAAGLARRQARRAHGRSRATSTGHGA